MDKRLYTNKVYEANDGKCLIIFDNEGNHKTISRITGNSEIEYITSQQSYDNSQIMGALSSENDSYDLL